MTGLDQARPEGPCQPAVHATARPDGIRTGRTIAVALAGTGQDGWRGVEWPTASGARIIVQHEATGVVWGMPGTDTRAGLADATLASGESVPETLRRV